MERVLLLTLFVLIGLAFVCNIVIYLKKSCADYKRKHAAEEPKEKEPEFVPADYYSAKLADECVSDNDYRFDTNRRDIFISAASDTGQLGSLWSRLLCIDFADNPKKLPHDLEEWFIENIDNFAKYGETLAFIEHYPILEDLFIDNLQLPDQNLALQKKLISVCIVGQWRVNYINLLVKYLSKWDFLPEIKAIVFCDERFERVKNIYKVYRQHIF